MGKFFNGQVKKDRTTLIRYIVIGCGVFFIILLFILIAAKNNRKQSVVLTPKDSVIVEINSDKPKATDFFEQIKGYNTDLISVDYGQLDTSKEGEYEVTISAKGYDSIKSKVIVKDTEVPTLILKELSIDYGDRYTIDDFIELCQDNSNTPCTLEYDKSSRDQTGSIIDYSSFAEEGTYIIRIVAKDKAGNESPIKETRLIIGTGEAPVTPTDCIYGDLTVSSSRVVYPIAVVVGDQNAQCALNRDLWDDKNVQEPVNKFYKEDYEALKKDVEATLKEQFPNGAKIVAYPNYVAVLNDELKGLVGYGIYVKVYMVSQDYTGTAIDIDENLALAYYIKSDHSRQYIVNKYNIK